MQQVIVRTAVALLCTLVGTMPARAQITTGVVTGSVKDHQGGVIPGAMVTLVSDTRGTFYASLPTLLAVMAVREGRSFKWDDGAGKALPV